MTGSPTARPVVDDKPVTVRLPLVTFPVTDNANPSEDALLFAACDKVSVVPEIALTVVPEGI
jgi:hypothetical protein